MSTFPVDSVDPEKVQLLITTYAVYIAITVAMCIWVGRTLSRNGSVFLAQAFSGNQDLARSVNHLLVVGFYLINLGYILLVLSLGARPDNVVTAIEMLSFRIGGVLIILGIMHFFNLFILSIIRRVMIRRQVAYPAAAARIQA